MNIISKLFLGAVTAAAISLPATAAFAGTTPQITKTPQGGNPKGGDPCKDSWSPQLTSQEGTPWSSSCKPAIPVVSDPCKWDKIPVTSWTWLDGRYVKCVKDENWDSCTPRPVTPPKPKCQCKTLGITFELPTYGSWLLDTGGPALHNGEVILYDGQDWTVGDWTPGASGSQGYGTYFTLTRNGHQLDGHGIRTQWATTVCTKTPPVTIPPVGNPTGGKGCKPVTIGVSSTGTVLATETSGPALTNGEEVVYSGIPAGSSTATDYYIIGANNTAHTFELTTTPGGTTAHAEGGSVQSTLDWTLATVCPAVTPLSVS